MGKSGCPGHSGYGNKFLVIIFCWLSLFAVMLAGCDSSPAQPANTLPTSLAQATSSLATPPTASIILPAETTKAAAISPTSTLTPAVDTSTDSLFSLNGQKSTLEWAEELVRNVKPADTSYEHKTVSVSWATQNGASSYSSHTDCSGLIIALLSQTYHLTPNEYQRWLHTTRPLAETFYQAISTQNGFTRIERIQQVETGDILAIRYPPGYGGDNTGHIMLIATKPQPHPVSKPLVAGTVQWDVVVIDSSESGHGTSDTRHRPDGTFGQGLGQGVFRFYTDDMGQMVGYTWSNFANSDYYDQQTRPFVVGRINPTFKIP